jgi:hypothetical protein
MAEREGFEPSREIAPPYRFSKPTPSASWVPLRIRTKFIDLLHKYIKGAWNGGMIRLQRIRSHRARSKLLCAAPWRPNHVWFASHLAILNDQKGH